MEKKYTYRQILVGFRQEYVRIRKELSELDDFLMNKNWKFNYNFRLNKEYHGYSEATLRLRAIERKKELLLDLKQVLKRMGLMQPRKASVRMRKNELGIYVPEGIETKRDKEIFDILILPRHEKEFAEKVGKVLEDEFCENMPFTDDELSEIKCNNHGQIFSTMSDYTQSLMTNKLSLDYNGLDEEIELYSVREKGNEYETITEDLLQETLDTKVSADSFSEYHKKAIESAPERNIVFSTDYKPVTHGNFRIIVNDKTLVLHKK